ncbi:hypothetical protein BPTFM16_01315 [Altererythrobacter insulae]|nr:hypothetical protein BPTFM16_01315 [Altererythrobacter insulae]
MRDFLRDFVRDDSGLAAEFALVLPLLLIFILGTIDVGLYAYRINEAEKATQIGARWAVVTSPIPTGLGDVSLVNINAGGSVILQGDRVPVLDFNITCTGSSTSCTCTGSDCGSPLSSSYTRDNDAFNALLGRMQDILPAIQAANLAVDYSGSGLGFAGDPNGPDVVPLITVRLVNMEHRSVVLSPLGVTTSLPDFAYSLTAEDMSGTASN